VLDHTIVQFDGIAAFQPVINGVYVLVSGLTYRQLLRGYLIKESGFRYIVNLDSDLHSKLNTTVT